MTVRDYARTELARAIASGELVVHYQPKIDLKRGAVWHTIGAEALVRWQHPVHGLIPPSEFIDLAEKTGLILPLTEFVLATAIEQIKLWRDDGMTVSVAVNLSAHMLTDFETPDRVADMLAKNSVPPSSLILEMTETAAMADVSRTIDILTRFRLKGIGLSMDDFGTGYSSLLQLHRMPFSELKIDRSFVIELGETQILGEAREALVLIRSMINLAHDLGIKICAEGVENRRALDILRSLGCDTAQGYYIGKPAPAAEMIRLLSGRKRAGVSSASRAALRPL